MRDRLSGSLYARKRSPSSLMLFPGSVSLSVETRMSVYYGLFFLSVGSFAPFAALWFNSLNLSPAMSGAIFAAPSIATVLFTVVIGRWADRLPDWRTAIIYCNWIVLVVLFWFLFRVGPWDILIVWTIAGLLAGQLFERFGMHWFVGVLLLSVAGRLAAAHALQPFRPERHGIRQKKVHGSGLVIFKQSGILLVILGSALIGASHGFNNMFSVMHWTNVGISTAMASILWAVSVIAEVALMWCFSSLARKFSARKCLLLASMVCAARWFLAGTDPSLVQLFVLQSLHSITFGLTFLATVNFIARRIPEDHAAQAQSVSATLMTLFMALAFWLSGWLYEQFAGHSYWAMSVLALLGGACVGWSFRGDLEDYASA